MAFPVPATHTRPFMPFSEQIVAQRHQNG